MKLIGAAAVGAVIGVVLGAAAGRLHHSLPGGGITARYEGIYAIGFALFAFGLAEVTIGNGLIAAFVCGIAMGASEREVPQGFVEFAENSSAILQVLTFFVFGGLIFATGFHHDIPPLVVFVVFALLVARPVAVMISFLRTGIPRSEKLFMAWFGPKGVASMLFALFVFKSAVGEKDLIFDVAAIAIITSIIAHGLTDTVGARWLARRVGLPTGNRDRSTAV
jgi:sodium/hydrogen antiporter